MHELEPAHFERVRALFEPFDYSLSIHAAIVGNNPGRIFVDDVRQPHTALALTVEGYLLAGDDDNPETNTALRRLLKDKIFTGEVFVNGDWSMSLAVHPETWEARLPELIPTHEMVRLERFHYLCRQLKYDWRHRLPAGYSVRRVDLALLSETDIIFAEPLRQWANIEEMWWNLDDYVAKGVSFCIVHDGMVVSWCLCDCVAGNRIDVGIFTHPEHRQRGLAAVATAATVEHCLNHGFGAVGWHCNADNLASWKTAEKVGFERNRDYVYYYCVFDPVDHLAELGWHYYKLGQIDRTAQYYDQVFSQREENPDYYYHLAAAAWAGLGDSDKALRYLNAAVDRGWTHFKYTEGVETFASLHSQPGWAAVLARMGKQMEVA